MIQAFAAEHLAEFKVPRRIVFLDEIPKGPTGKLHRIGLAEQLAETGSGLFTDDAETGVRTLYAETGSYQPH